MKRDEELALAPGRKLDALVAEKVMGWRPRVDFDVIDDLPCGVARYEPFSMDVRTFAPSSEIAAAFEVAEKMRESHLYVDVRTCSNFYEVWVTLPPFQPGIPRTTETVTLTSLPLAICRAALLACIGGDNQ